MQNNIKINELNDDYFLQIPAEFADNKVLMHSCCAPCAGDLMERMIASKIDLTIFFYNPNIHPKKEYEIRKNENIRFAEKLGIPFIDADYDVQNWFARAKGLEYSPERGERCTKCFDMRFERTALYAHENGFKVITSSLGISRWKNMEQINECGIRASKNYDGMNYWTYNWRKAGGAERMYKIAKKEEFYKQEYCGCIFSLRDSNEWRVSKGRDEIKIGEEFYKEVEIDKEILKSKKNI
jgi:epoxyqueuosine reductase